MSDSIRDRMRYFEKSNEEIKSNNRKDKIKQTFNSKLRDKAVQTELSEISSSGSKSKSKHRVVGRSHSAYGFSTMPQYFVPDPYLASHDATVPIQGFSSRRQQIIDKFKQHDPIWEENKPSEKENRRYQRNSEKIAAMEENDRLSKIESGQQAGARRRFLGPNRNGRRSVSRTTRNRRSMSDPNLQKTFQAIKSLWDNKVQNDPVAPKIVTQNYTRAQISPGASTKTLNAKGKTRFLSESNDTCTSKRNDEPHVIGNIKPKFSPEKPQVALKPKELTNKKEPTNKKAIKPNVPPPSVPPNKPVKEKTTTSPTVFNRAKMFEDAVRKNNVIKSSRQNNAKSPTDDANHPGNKTPYGSFNKTKPEELTSRLRKKKNDDEEALLLNYEENESEDLSHLKDNANSARKKRSNSKRTSVISSNSDSSIHSSHSNEAIVIHRSESRNSLPKSASNKSFLHSNTSSRRNSIEKEDNVTSKSQFHQTSSFERKDTLTAPSPTFDDVSRKRTSSIHNPENTGMHHSHSASSLYQMNTEITPARKLSITNLQQAARSGSMERSPSPAVQDQEEVPKRRNSALHRQSKSNKTENGRPKSPQSNTNMRLSPTDRYSTDSGTGSASESSVGNRESNSSVSDEGKDGSFTSLTIINPQPLDVPNEKQRPVSMHVPIKPSRPAPPLPLSKTKSDTQISKPKPISTPDSVFNAEEEYIKIVASLSSSEDLKANEDRDFLEVPRDRNDTWSDCEAGSDDDAKTLTGTPSHSVTSPTSKTETVQIKIHNIAKELLSTEESYVEILHLIDQVFHTRVNEAIARKIIPQDIRNIFSNVSAIYTFHSEFLLPQLKERLAEWESNPRLGDIMTKAAPFLKMYSLYVQNFDEAMNLIKFWSEKSNNFKNIIMEIQKMPECKCLSLQHHMLGPVQRIPRYKMLLEDYLKRIAPDSPDRPEATLSLDLISKAANHSNETMRQTDKFQKLWALYNSLDISLDLGVSRELLLEGKITKISARNGEKYERYLFLFSDMLLCCTPINRIGKKYKVNANIDLDGMEVIDVKNMTVPNTFCVHGLKKSMDFAASSPAEKEKWVKAIGSAVDSFYSRKTSFHKLGSGRRKKASVVSDGMPNSPSSKSPDVDGQISEEQHDAHHHLLVEIADDELGKRAPRWIKDNEVTLCMVCSKKFHQLKRRRHHCRACGRVICTECSEHKLELEYEPGKPFKVCTRCYDKLTGKKHEETDKKGVLEVKADTVSEKSVLSEYLFYNELERKKGWIKRWCVIPRHEPCLYIFGAHQDVRATKSMPLIGFQIKDVSKQSTDREFCFKLSQATTTLVFSAESNEQRQRWKKIFELASEGKEMILHEDSSNLNNDISSKIEQNNNATNSMLPVIDDEVDLITQDKSKVIYETIPALKTPRPTSSISTGSTTSELSSSSMEGGTN